MSSACVAALICSLLVCIPFLTQLAGLVLGIVGLGYTSGQKARGRGMAIAALILSPLGALAWCGVGVIMAQLMLPLISLDRKILPLWSDDAPTMTQAATDLHDTLFSRRLQMRVNQAALLDFAQAVVAELGPIQSLKPTQTWLSNRQDDVGWTLNLQGEFAQKTTSVSILVGLDGFQPQIDNITVGDQILDPDQ